MLTTLKKLITGRRPDDQTATLPAVPTSAVQVSTEELIRLRLAARSLPLSSRQLARGSISGGHRSRFRGRGMDYAESRAYQAGDDIRHMDWRVTARSGTAHVKVYQEERERPVIVMLDLGPGMHFATQGAFKSVIAARAAALLGWAAVHHGDRVGALLFNGRHCDIEHKELRPVSGQRGVLNLIRELVPATQATANVAPAPTHNAMNQALLRLRHVARSGSLVFIFSDFHNIDTDTRNQLQRLRRHNNVVACPLIDALELAPPPPDRYAISDGAHSRHIDLHSNSQRQAWAGYFQDHRQRLGDLLSDCAIAQWQLTTGDDVAARLRAYLQNGAAPARPDRRVAA